jgi:SAM-dependent methyltransferase
MLRSFETEFLDSPDVPEDVLVEGYRELARMQRLLGNTRAIVSALRRDPLPVRRVLDIGCASGGVLLDVQRALGVEAVGVDVRPARAPEVPLPIVQADATRDPLPAADVAFSTCMGHHLSEEDLAAMIRNVGRSCRRFILLDLVRHPLPLALFRVFMRPLFAPYVIEDGIISIRRAYTPLEMEGVVRRALDGTGGRFRHSVAPFYTRQIADISFGAGGPGSRAGEYAARDNGHTSLSCRASSSYNAPTVGRRPSR